MSDRAGLLTTAFDDLFDASRVRIVGPFDLVTAEPGVEPLAHRRDRAERPPHAHRGLGGVVRLRPPSDASRRESTRERPSSVRDLFVAQVVTALGKQRDGLGEGAAPDLETVDPDAVMNATCVDSDVDE